MNKVSETKKKVSVGVMISLSIQWSMFFFFFFDQSLAGTPNHCYILFVTGSTSKLSRMNEFQIGLHIQAVWFSGALADRIGRSISFVSWWAAAHRLE